MADPDTITVSIDGRRFPLAPGDELTFGRSATCTVCLDESDLAISRLTGRFEAEAGVWWVVNLSSTRPLATVDEYGLRSVLPPGRRRAVDGPVRVLVEGGTRTHTLAVDAPRQPADDEGWTGPGALTDESPTTVGGEVVLTDVGRAALVALFAGYLDEGPRYDPNPKSYAAAAARLGWPRTTLVKRVEYLRTRLSASGVPNLTGWNALHNLAEYALTSGLISRADLDALRGN